MENGKAKGIKKRPLNYRMVTSRHITYYLLTILIGSVVGALISIYYPIYKEHKVKALYDEIKDRKQVYVYDVFLETLNPAMYIKSKEDANGFIEFYSKIEKKDKKAVISFPILYLPIGSPVYIYDENLSDTSLVEVVDIDTSAFKYNICYVYKNTVHKNPPNDSLLLDYSKFVKSRDSITLPHWQKEK